jgi:aminoglycoside phosphotransferase (APT) family kinase protein
MRSDDAVRVRPGEEIDVARVAEFVREHVPGCAAPLEVLQFPGGHANLTYLLRFGELELVLRRPPQGPLPRGAHDMAREHGVLSVLWREFPLAPRALALCEDPAVIGAPFFIMERRHGLVVRTEVPRELDVRPDGRRRAGLALVDGLADLHAVDPAALGLDGLGRPAGFLDRQLSGWRSRWERAADRERPVFARVHAELAATQPRSLAPALVHNDWKLDNAMLDPDDPGRLHAVLDWDMTTQGDPLVDLGTLLAYWSEPGDRGARRRVTPVTAQRGFPTRAELASRYAARRGASLEAIRWYEAFGLWRLAVILQQLYIRFARGQTADSRFARFGDTAGGLLDAAAALLGVPIG